MQRTIPIPQNNAHVILFVNIFCLYLPYYDRQIHSCDDFNSFVYYVVVAVCADHAKARVLENVIPNMSEINFCTIIHSCKYSGRIRWPLQAYRKVFAHEPTLV